MLHLEKNSALTALCSHCGPVDRVLFCSSTETDDLISSHLAILAQMKNEIMQS